MDEFKYTTYFEKEVLRKRPYIKIEWCIDTVKNPEKSEQQEDNRYRFWKKIPDLNNRYFRVRTLDDKVTIHNAFPDRRYKP